MVKMNLFAKQKQRHICREQIVDTKVLKEGGEIRRLGLTYIHCIKQITNENPENATQCPVVT